MKEFAAAEMTRRREEEKLLGMSDALENSRKELAGKTVEGIVSQQIHKYMSFFVAQRARIHFQRTAVQQAQLDSMGRRSEMIQAVTRRKVVDRLREKHEEELERERLRREANQLDELVGSRFAYRRLEGAVRGD